MELVLLYYVHCSMEAPTSQLLESTSCSCIAAWFGSQYLYQVAHNHLLLQIQGI